MYFAAELIVLDEPTTALSLTESEKVFNFMRNVRASGRSVIFISHNFRHAYDVVDRFVILDRGQVVMEATNAEFSSAEDLAKNLQRIAREGHY
jgi:simple sugar transport system ATP-binding protein